MINYKDHSMIKGNIFFHSYQIFLIKIQFLFEASSFGHFSSTIPIYFSINCEQFLYIFFLF